MPSVHFLEQRSNIAEVDKLMRDKRPLQILPDDARLKMIHCYKLDRAAAVVSFWKIIIGGCQLDAIIFSSIIIGWKVTYPILLRRESQDIRQVSPCVHPLRTERTYERSTPSEPRTQGTQKFSFHIGKGVLLLTCTTVETSSIRRFESVSGQEVVGGVQQSNHTDSLNHFQTHQPWRAPLV